MAVAWPTLDVAAVQAQDACAAPAPACAALAAVFGVSAFDPYGSGVRIGPDLLVTNRHVIADEVQATVRLPDGGEIKAQVIPTSYAGDLILLRAPLPPGPVLAPGGEAAGALYTVGQDVNQRRMRVFPEGHVLVPPDPAKPYARLHHTAYTQPGNSGGALVNAQGALVGIATSGGEGRFEAVPAAQIARLKAESGPEHAARSGEIGRAYRDCTLLLEDLGRGKPDPKVLQDLSDRCTASDNRQLMDQAAGTLGRAGALEESVTLYERGLAKDPGAVNERVGLVVSLFRLRRYADTAPHLRRLMEVIPEDPQVHRFAIQAGKFAGDAELMQKGLDLVTKYDPAQLEAAKRFIDAPLPQPRR